LPKAQAKLKTIDFLIYNKLKDRALFFEIVNYLKSKNYNIKIFEYGKFKQPEYFEALEYSRFEIYLSDSESQGLAMFEAWARGVPTLIFEKGVWERSGIKVSGKISAPYLSSECGESFSNFNDFSHSLTKLLSSSYNPENYVQKNFTNEVCAKKYLNVLPYV
jgi:hypothetical protein